MYIAMLFSRGSRLFVVMEVIVCDNACLKSRFEVYNLYLFEQYQLLNQFAKLHPKFPIRVFAALSNVVLGHLNCELQYEF